LETTKKDQDSSELAVLRKISSSQELEMENNLLKNREEWRGVVEAAMNLQHPE